MMGIEYTHLKERLMFYSDPTGMRWRVMYDKDTGWSKWLSGADYEPDWYPLSRYEVEPIPTLVYYQQRMKVPTPERVAPSWGAEYYVPQEWGAESRKWNDSRSDNRLLADGMVYISYEDAEARHQAWLKLEKE